MVGAHPHRPIAAPAALTSARPCPDTAPAATGCWTWDLRTRRVRFDTRAARLLGLPASQPLPLREVLAALHRSDRRLLEAALRSADKAGVEVDVRRAGPGAPRWVRVYAAPTDDGLVLGCAQDVTGLRRIIDELRAREARLVRLSLHDELTGLPTRAFLLEHLARTLAEGPEGAGAVTVVVLELLRFGEVCEHLGHEAGDEVLHAAGRRLASLAERGDVVARLGVAEFAVVLTGVPAVAAVARAGRMARALGRPFAVDGGEAVCGVAAGVAFAAGPGATPRTLVRDALTALARSRAGGGGRVEVLDDEVRERLARRASAAAELDRALRRDELVLWAQPEVDLASGSPVGCELLVRWRHPGRGVLAPAEFVPLAEELGLGARMGAWVLDRGCQAAGYLQSVRPGLVVRLNLSAAQLADDRLVAQVDAALRREGLAAGVLCLEVTETAVAAADLDRATRQLCALKELGVQLAIDDFGTGFSSMTLLRRLPVDVVKIDRSFVAGVADDPEDRAIVRASIELAAALGKEVTAEGIETADHLAGLLELGCGRGQGYWFARPQPLEVFEDWLRHRR